jgi:hypothetical protein
MMPQQQVPQQAMPQQPFRQVNRSAKFSNPDTRATLETLINSTTLSGRDKITLIDYWYPKIAEVEEQASHFRFWHNRLILGSGIALLALFAAAGENVSLGGGLGQFDHYFIILLVIFIGICDLLEYRLHYDRKAYLYKVACDDAVREFWSFLQLGSSYQNSQNETEAVNKLISKFVEIMRRLDDRDD